MATPNPPTNFDPSGYSNLREYVEAVQGSPLDYSNPQQQGILSAAVASMYGGQGTTALQAFFPQPVTASAASTSTPTAAVAAPLDMQSVANTPGMGVNGIGTSNVVAPPVAAVATTSAPAPNYEQMVRDAYGSIGRTGVGDAASNIDQAGFDYWVNTLQSGASTPEAFGRNFQTAVADYLVTKPEDQYSTYVTDFLTETKPAAVSEIVDLYQDVLGRDPDAAGLGNWFQQFGSEISPEERATFETSAKTELDSRVQGLYTDFLGRDADAEGIDYWRDRFGSTIDDDEREAFRQSAATEINKQFGVTGDVTAPTTEGVLSGFKYANDSGITEDKLKKTLGEDVFNTYKTGFADYAKTGIANILADKQLSFDEARTAVKFGRDYGYDAQKMADLTGTKKEVFDAIYKNYDDTTDKVVDTVLGAEDVKTDGDRIERALALQKQYGFTDEDLAKASGYDVKELKAALDPARNFDADYKKLVEDPNRSDDQMKAFLTSSLQNPFLKQKLGDRLQPALDELNKPPRERILGQVEQQRNVLGGQYYQGVFGNPEKIADVLEKKGVKSLADLGEKEKFATTKADVKYTTNDGRPVSEYDGRFYVNEDVGESSQSREVPADQVQTAYGRNEYVQEGDGGYSQFVPLTAEEQATLKDGKYQEKLGTVVVNKKTGEELTDTSHQLAYQSSSGGLNKKKNYLNVNFTKEGVPVLTASREKAGLGAFVQQALPVLAMALPFALPGVGAALSSGLASVGGSTLAAGSLANAALTQGLISGGLTTLGGGQFEKGFLGGAVSPVISSGIGSLLPTGMDPNIAKAVTGVGTGAVKGALQGESFEDLLKSGILSGVANYGLGEATKGLNLTPQQLNFATGIALPLLQGQKVSPTKLLTTLASTAQQQSKGKTP